MKLSDFSVVNYRSITTARKIKTNNMTVLVGKNNEGKHIKLYLQRIVRYLLTEQI